MFATLFAVLAVLAFAIALASGWFACQVERKLSALEARLDAPALAVATPFDHDAFEARQIRHQAIAHRLQLLNLPTPPDDASWTFDEELEDAKLAALRELVKLLAVDVEPTVVVAGEDELVDW